MSTPTPDQISEWRKEARAHCDVDKWELGIRAVADYYTEGYLRAKTEQSAQPEPVDPHATLRAEYAKQVKEGTTGFYLWEFMTTTNPGVWQQKTTGDKPHWTATTQYRCTDISCMLSKDGEPAIRMLKAEARELQCNLGGTVGWSYESTDGRMFTGYATNSKIIGFEATSGVYTYKTKAPIKLDGRMVTREQAVAEWEAQKDTHDVYSISAIGTTLEKYPRFSLTFDGGNGYWYELRPKWTGSRDDVIALLKEKGLL